MGQSQQQQSNEERLHLRAVRLKRGLTQAQLAAKVNVSNSLISLMERGKLPVAEWMWVYLNHNPDRDPPPIPLDKLDKYEFSSPERERQKGLALRRQIAAILRDHPTLKTAVIARNLGVSDMTVMRHRRVIEGRKH